ncbi:MAG: succinylglutamate desuccinylase/aspartoacylase family protein [Holophagales bacterium]|nr:succinylglutamate desuccinylase/aspartoacylase family protein [Holophagales bacterium]
MPAGGKARVDESPTRFLFLASICVAAVGAAGRLQGAAPADLPEDHRGLTKSTSYEGMAAFLKTVDGRGPVVVSVEGTTAQARSLFLIHASRGGSPSFRILFYAQQHGDEVSGKDALLYLVRDIVRDPSRLPKDVDLWIIPMMNPDGAEAGKRRNAMGADLNRDHVTQFQPETQALHRVARRLKPHLSVDAHEFGRDSEEWTKKGWEKWSDITMDGLNNPLFDAERIAAARKWVDEVAGAEQKAGHCLPPLLGRRCAARRRAAPLGARHRRRAQRHRRLRRPLVHHRGRGPPPREGPLGRSRKARRCLPRPLPALPRGGRPPRGRPRRRRAGAEAPASRVPSLGRPLGEPGRGRDGVSRRRGRHGCGPEGPDGEPDDRGRREADRPDASRLRGRPGGGARDRGAPHAGTASRSRRSYRPGR